VWICDFAELTVPITTGPEFAIPKKKSAIISKYYTPFKGHITANPAAYLIFRNTRFYFAPSA